MIVNKNEEEKGVLVLRPARKFELRRFIELFILFVFEVKRKLNES